MRFRQDQLSRCRGNLNYQDGALHVHIYDPNKTRVDQNRCEFGAVNFVWGGKEPVLCDKNIMGIFFFSSGVLGFVFLK